MPAFEPSYYRTILVNLEDEREQTYFSKSHYQEHWENLRTLWSDSAGRNVNNRTMTPLLELYEQFLQQSQTYLETKKRTADRFAELEQSLIESSHHHEHFNKLMATLHAHSDERDRTLRSSESLSKQAEEQEKEVAEQMRAANSHVSPM